MNGFLAILVPVTSKWAWRWRWFRGGREPDVVRVLWFDVQRRSSTFWRQRWRRPCDRGDHVTVSTRYPMSPTPAHRLRWWKN